MARKYSYMYSRLVKSDQDVVGSIAYSLYKSAKIAYIKQFESENGPIPEAKLLEYDNTQRTSQQIELYLEKAQTLVTAMNQSMLASVINQIEAECNSRHKTMIEDALKTGKKSFWYGVWQSLVGAFAYSLCLVVVALILLLVKPEVQNTLIKLLG